MKNNLRKSSRRGRGRSKSGRVKIFSPTSIIPIVVVAALVSLILYANNRPSQSDSKALSDMGGNLRHAVTAPGIDEELVEYTGMLVSFNPERHIPNWVSWELTADKVQGDEPRGNGFTVDPAVDGCATPADYRHTGFDRGHMAPAGDMKWSKEAMDESFHMTNICPQDHKLNTGAWRKLEESCRRWAMRDSALVIVCGPVPTDAPDMKIGTNEVWVPKRFFKAIIAPYATQARGIAFVMPNQYVKGGMQASAVSIDQVEAMTGHDLFHELPDDIEQQVESQCNFNQWSY